MSRLSPKTAPRLPATAFAVLITLAVAEAPAQVLIEGQRATAPAKSCVQQIRQDRLQEPQAVRAALDQCIRARMAERQARPAPVRPQAVAP